MVYYVQIKTRCVCETQMPCRIVYAHVKVFNSRFSKGQITYTIREVSSQKLLIWNSKAIIALDIYVPH
jgi:hypothetical protein